MKTIADAIKSINPNAQVIVKETIIDDVDNAEITWLENTAEISKADIKAKLTEIKNAETNEEQAKEDLKASAKAKLMAGEALTEDEANVMIGG